MASGMTDVTYCKGVGETRARLLNKLGVDCVDALVRFYPRDYSDLSVWVPLGQTGNAETVCVKARITGPIRRNYIRKNMVLYKFPIADETAGAVVTLYNNPYLAEKLKEGEEYLFYGKISADFGGRSLSSPQIVPPQKAGLIPIYRTTRGLNSAGISRMVQNALAIYTPPEIFSEVLRARLGLCGISAALEGIHFPKNREQMEQAKRRLVFEELFSLQVALKRLKNETRETSSYRVGTDCTEKWIATLPFSLTGAQRRVIGEAVADMQSGKQMNRLLQGDVGSGKTAVAAALCYQVIQNGYQAAVMAPTEVLAEQHYRTFSRFYDGMGISCALLTGSTPKKEKQQIKEGLKNGSISLVLGTHALLTDDVSFSALALCITDEQHRFGVSQREKLIRKGLRPHTLVMSATPIPRTLAMIFYADLDISLLDEYPKDRQSIRSYQVPPSYLPRIYAFLRKNIAEGRQAYIVCPAVEENEAATDLTSAEALYEDLSRKEFCDIPIGLLHGKMKPKEKERVMRQFADGEIRVLVATTVIEVGIDVPNATVMVIENAERFGLSTLHQLRGRIGRGSYASTCIFVSHSKKNERLDILCKTRDGFRIADEDLKLRGPGELLGSRQSGLPQFRIADLSRDLDLVRESSAAAAACLKEDPLLADPRNAALRQSVNDLLRLANL